MHYLLILVLLMASACSNDPEAKSAIGESCEAPGDCEGDACITSRVGVSESLTFPAGYCTTKECTVGSAGLACADGEGICLTYIPSGDHDCYLGCLVDEDCPREDYGCFAFHTGGACIPASVIPGGEGVAPFHSDFKSQ